MGESAICPKCGKKSTTTSGTTLHAFYCRDCKMEFEPMEVDGIDPTIGRGSPSRRLEREEERAARMAVKRSIQLCDRGGKHTPERSTGNPAESGR